MESPPSSVTVCWRRSRWLSSQLNSRMVSLGVADSIAGAIAVKSHPEAQTVISAESQTVSAQESVMQLLPRLLHSPVIWSVEF